MLNFIQFCLPYRLLLFATFYLELFINIIFSQSLKQITAMILISVFFFISSPTTLWWDASAGLYTTVRLTMRMN